MYIVGMEDVSVWGGGVVRVRYGYGYNTYSAGGAMLQSTHHKTGL